VKEILVKEIMIPISDYVTVRKSDNLTEVLRVIEERRATEQGHAHRDAIVVDENGRFVGKVTMIDIFRSLEPNFRKTKNEEERQQTLTDAFVQNAVKDFKLWLEPVESVCERGGKVTVAEAIHIPEKSEYLKEDDSLEKEMNYYVMGVHQPLIVRKGDEVTGILRFGDVFEIVREQLVNCALG
jgi:CBS domain containing-hemolysin-like protein